VQSVRGILEHLETKLAKKASAKGVERLAISLTWPFTRKETDQIMQSIERLKVLLFMAFEKHHVQLSTEIDQEGDGCHSRQIEGCSSSGFRALEQSIELW